MTVSSPILEASGLYRASDDGTALLDNVSLTMAAGSSTGIVGPPGAGKTLLLRALALLDPLHSGEVRFRGQPVPDREVPGVRRQVLLVPQRPMLVAGTVRDNLRLPFLFRQQTGQEFDQDRILELLISLGHQPAFLERSVSNLSGGESQTVAVLRAIQLNPAVLLLDEPTSSLDAETTSAVERLMLDWRGANNERALVAVTHSIEQADRLAQRTVRMERGSIVSEEQHAGQSA